MGNIKPTDFSNLGGNLGDRFTTNKRRDVYILCYWDGSSPAACAKGDAVFINAVANASGNNPAISAAATTAVNQMAGIVTTTLAAAGLVWVQIEGYCDFAKLEGTTDIAAGDQLQMVNAQTYLVKDGGTGRTADSLAIAQEAYTTNSASTAVKKINLLGGRVTIG